MLQTPHTLFFDCDFNLAFGVGGGFCFVEVACGVGENVFVMAATAKDALQMSLTAKRTRRLHSNRSALLTSI